MDAEPEVIRKELPSGDPVRSIGTYDKIKEVLGVDIESFADLGSGLVDTVEYDQDQESHDGCA